MAGVVHFPRHFSASPDTGSCCVDVMVDDELPDFAEETPLYRSGFVIDGKWELGVTSYSGTFCDVTEAKPAGRNVPFSYAVKTLRPQWKNSQAAIAMMQREAEIGQTITHPHLVPVFEDKTNDAAAYLVQPFLQGKTLQYFLSEKNCRPNFRETIWIVRQIAEALAELEKHDFCHADVKPANIVISETGHATLIDLGLARRFREKALPIDRFLGGTKNYIAPELLENSAVIDSCSDIYSLGIVMGEMLFGEQFLFCESKQNEIPNFFRQLLIESNFIERNMLRYFIPKTESLLCSMLTISPENRLKSASQLVRELIAIELVMI